MLLDIDEKRKVQIYKKLITMQQRIIIEYNNCNFIELTNNQTSNWNKITGGND